MNTDARQRAAATLAAVTAGVLMVVPGSPAAAADATSPWANSEVACYVVPAISSVKRLPDAPPTDGRLGDRLDLVAARGEFEPVSFVVLPRSDVARFELKAGALGGAKGRIPADHVDIKVVKCWYQAGTAWHSYFADSTRRELVPELLLNDETLVKVDHDARDNYLRVDYPEGSRYVWVSYPARADRGAFNYDTEPVADTAELQPVQLTTGRGKQFWVTVKVPEDAAPGLYRGSITLVADGKAAGAMALNVRVLPFALPMPKTYYDLGREFYTSIYNHCSMLTHLDQTGGDFEQAERKLRAEFENMRDHGVYWPKVPGSRGKRLDALKRHLELMKESGLRVRPLFGGVYSFADYSWMHTPREERDPEVFEKYKGVVDEALALISDVLGHGEVYCVGWDEPGAGTLVGQRECWTHVHEQGALVYSTAREFHLDRAGYNEDFVNYPGSILKRESVRKWHAMGGRVTNYAGPHTGPENPDFIRRTHGMRLYMADYDGTCNYQYYEGKPNIWNEFDKTSYRSFCMVYPTRDDVIDTLAWEGFREAIDDVRYATKLRQVAADAIEGGGVRSRYAAKQALQWLANLDPDTVDLNTMRLEMINTILGLIETTKEDG